MCAQSVAASAARTQTTTATPAPIATNPANREAATKYGITQCMEQKALYKLAERVAKTTLAARPH
jgi:spore coat protein CotF